MRLEAIELKTETGVWRVTFRERRVTEKLSGKQPQLGWIEHFIGWP